MKAAYVDSSCLVCIALGERAWRSTAERLESFERLYSSTLLEAELRCVLAREKVTASPAELLAPVTWVHPRQRLSSQLDLVLAAGYVRGPDAFHLATALFLAPSPSDIHFLTLDKRQAQAARRLGFPT